MLDLLSSVLWSILIFLIVSVLYYRRSKRPPPAWDRCSVYNHPELSFVDTLRVVFGKRHIHAVDVFGRVHYGRIYGVREANLDLLTITDEDALKFLFKDQQDSFCARHVIKGGDPVYDSMVSELDGDEWESVRAQISEGFSPEYIEMLAPLIQSTSEVLIENLIRQGGEPTDAKKDQFDHEFEKYFSTPGSLDKAPKEHLDSFSLDAIATTIFGLETDTYAKIKGEFIRHANNFFGQTSSWRFLLHMLVPKLAALLGISFVDGSATKFFKKLAIDEIRRRKREKVSKMDYLQILISNARNVKKGLKRKAKEKVEETEVRPPGIVKYKFLNEDETAAQCVMFFTKGVACVSSTLSFLCFELATNPAIQERLREEIDAAIFESDGQITYDRVLKLRYLNRVFFETLRKYPPVVRIIRKTQQEEEFTRTASGYYAYKGTLVSVPVYAIHHNSNIYPNPSVFDPERFTHEAMESRFTYNFLPFGRGYRNCAGALFSQMEVKMCIVNILSRLIIKPCSKTEESPKVECGYGLLIPTRIVLCFEKRQAQRSL